MLAVTPTRNRAVPGAGGWARLVAPGDAEELGEIDADALAEALAEGDVVPVALLVALGVADGDDVGPAVGDGVRVGEGETVGLGLADDASVGVVAETGSVVSPMPTLTTRVPTVSPTRKRLAVT